MLVLFVNAAVILLGGMTGMLIKNRLPQRITDAVLIGIGLFTIYVGVTGLTRNTSSIVYLLAIVPGGALGTALRLEERLDALAQKLQAKLTGDGESRFAEGFAGFFIMSCVGAFTTVASFNVGLGDSTMLWTKCVMDLVVSMAMASSLGIGVVCAGVPIVLYEAILAAFAGALSPLLSEGMLDAFSCMGAILTLAIGLNVAGVSKFKVVNYLPSLLLAPLAAFLFERFGA